MSGGTDGDSRDRDYTMGNGGNGEGSDPGNFPRSLPASWGPLVGEEEGGPRQGESHSDSGGRRVVVSRTFGGPEQWFPTTEQINSGQIFS